MHFKTDWKTYKRMYFKICFRIESRRDKAASVWPQTKRIGARAFLGSSRLAPKRGIRRDDPAGCLTG